MMMEFLSWVIAIASLVFGALGVWLTVLYGKEACDLLREMMRRGQIAIATPAKTNVA